MLRGHISTEWHGAILHSLSQSHPKLTSPQLDRQANQWQRRIIHHLWENSKQVRAVRNAFIHGQLQESTVSKELQSLCSRASTHFDNYASDRYYVSSVAIGLLNRPLETIQALNRDSLLSWLLSVEEGVALHQHWEKKRQKSQATILQWFLQQTSTPQLTWSVDLHSQPPKAKWSYS